MICNSFLLGDVDRVEQFALIGANHGLLRNYHSWRDRNGIPWAGRQLGRHMFAITPQGPSWIFDDCARSRLAERFRVQQERMQSFTTAQLSQEASQIIARMPLGPQTERVLWCVQRELLRVKNSVLVLPDIELGAATWGGNRENWPRRWRHKIKLILQGLAWLHVAVCEEGRLPPLGAATALLTYVSDLRGGTTDDCQPYCAGHGDRHHSHFLINTGRGFLGRLEALGQVDSQSGCRYYEFTVGSPRTEGQTLWRIGKTGGLVQVYLPAKIGEPAACKRLSARQHRLLQALLREQTRRKRGRRTTPAKPEIIKGNEVPDSQGRSTLVCPLLNPTGRYVTFGGNKKRRGCGYLLCSPGGWLRKAGYELDDVRRFFADLGGLAGMLKLTVVGLLPTTGAWHNLDQLTAMAGSSTHRNSLQRIHVRVYADAGYVEQWDAIFAPSDRPASPNIQERNALLALASKLTELGKSKRALARGLTMDYSRLCKIFSETRPCPADLVARANAWLSASQTVDACPPRPAVIVTPSSSLHHAIEYLRRGWSVVPQLPKAKCPCIKWKPYQDERPTESNLHEWYARWPDAGIAVVLGPVSGLLVLDVDGIQGHTALIDHLGQVPVAPQVISGSREPHRYHLFFLHPALTTRAKTTPWSPKLEFRGKGGIVIAPPSLHKSGNRYAWDEGKTLDDLAIPELPAPVLDALRAKSGSVAATAPALPIPQSIPDVAPSTREFLEGLYAQGPCWNERLFRAACDLAGRQIPRQQAERLLLVGAQPTNDQNREIALRTIRSAFTEPRQPGVV